jgi:predicted Zn finger-like uncharacterized protein
MNTKCPQCDTSYNVPSANIGRKVKCKSCSAALVMTEAGLELQGAPAPPPPPPPPRVEPPPAFEFDAEQDDPGREEEKPRRSGKAKGSRREVVEEEIYDDDGPSGVPVRKAKGPSNFGEYLKFRKMIVPVIIQTIFWIIVGIMVIASLGYSVLSMLSGSTTIILGTLVGLIITVPFGILIVRIYCELIIIMFRMYDALVDIKTLLEKQSGGDKETVSEALNP